ncbi:MAG: selenium-binding protein [Gemmatimonadetes bacterium]|uniref:Methanethiol oxidase n=1 Tax=Candidatus Kutchimonas denitrificans TaxID=3056748 RepID=A0AAE4Z599_9BACT|nr:selenium-binding protein [Gemmatimonadota bacterium]NIR73594.1 selenium-binding protein [Candidatus Kutchimonas denitrificans]NIR99553.1 selenium-binding protein [Gemmatimonadota bacterium]NIT65173.1 selenium-binding protein [Gemmatimonadota bacterium]NIV23706.1 selenium-binding protein [Gemmatimonadota bacterium]
MRLTLGIVAVGTAGLMGAAIPNYDSPDESVFVDNLERGERESLLYVWTRDADGKDSDFLAVVDVDPGSESYGEIIDRAPTGSAANEAHHFGYNTDASRIYGGGLFSNKLFIYDVESNPRDPKLIRTVDLDPTGYSGPHTLYAVPGGVLLSMLGQVGGGGPAALVKVNDAGEFLEAYPAEGSDVPKYMYDVGVKPQINRMITSSWAHPEHVKEMGGANPEDVGDEVVVWDWKNKEVLRVEHLDATPLEVRWLHGPRAHGGFINCAYGNTVWYWEDTDGDDQLEFHRVIEELPEGSVPADMRVSYDNRFLYVSLWGAGEVRQYDVSNPLQPTLVSKVDIPQPNMMSLSRDNRRLYVTNSLLSTMDGDVEFGAWMIHVGPEGMKIDENFAPDFYKFDTGPAGPHDMLLK